MITNLHPSLIQMWIEADEDASFAVNLRNPRMTRGSRAALISAYSNVFGVGRVNMMIDVLAGDSDTMADETTAHKNHVERLRKGHSR